MEVVMSFAAAIVFVAIWRICRRAGFPGALALLALVPWIGLLVIGAVLSFASWPPSRR